MFVFRLLGAWSGGRGALEKQLPQQRTRTAEDSGVDSVVYFLFSLTFFCSLYFWNGFWGGFFGRGFWGGFCGEDYGVDSVVDVLFSLTVFSVLLFVKRVCSVLYESTMVNLPWRIYHGALSIVNLPW